MDLVSSVGYSLLFRLHIWGSGLLWAAVHIDCAGPANTRLRLRLSGDSRPLIELALNRSQLLKNVILMKVWAIHRRSACSRVTRLTLGVCGPVTEMAGRVENVIFTERLVHGPYARGLPTRSITYLWLFRVKGNVWSEPSVHHVM